MFTQSPPNTQCPRPPSASAEYTKPIEADLAYDVSRINKNVARGASLGIDRGMVQQAQGSKPKRRALLAVRGSTEQRQRVQHYCHSTTTFWLT